MSDTLSGTLSDRRQYAAYAAYATAQPALSDLDAALHSLTVPASLAGVQLLCRVAVLAPRLPLAYMRHHQSIPRAGCLRDVPAVSAGANSASLSRACTSRLGMSGHRMRRYSRRSVGRRRTLQPQISVPSGLSLVRPFLELSKVRGCAFVGRGRGRCRPPTRSQPEWPDGRTRPRLCTGEAGRYSPGRAAAVA